MGAGTGRSRLAAVGRGGSGERPGEKRWGGCLSRRLMTLFERIKQMYLFKYRVKGTDLYALAGMDNPPVVGTRRGRDGRDDEAADSSLKQLSWDQIRNVFDILKKQGLLGPLSTFALSRVYPQLYREYEAGGSQEFRQKWTRQQWFNEITTHYFPELNSVEVANAFRLVPDDANFFHVFIACMVWFMAWNFPGRQRFQFSMTRNGIEMVVVMVGPHIGHWSLYDSNKKQKGYGEKNRMFNIITSWDGSWDGSMERSHVVPFVYRALQEGWRFSPEVKDMIPDNVNASINMDCAHCGASQPTRTCGNGCGTLYCNDNCANAHWFGEAAHFEHCK
jgi:hypothetical protein